MVAAEVQGVPQDAGLVERAKRWRDRLASGRSTERAVRPDGGDMTAERTPVGGSAVAGSRVLAAGALAVAVLASLLIGYQLTSDPASPEPAAPGSDQTRALTEYDDTRMEPEDMLKEIAAATFAATVVATPVAAETMKDEFTGSFAYGPGIEDADGEQFRQRSVRFSDPRLEGDVVLTADTELLDDGLYMNSFRIENEDGAWQGDAEYGFYPGSEIEPAATTVHVLRGEGEYAGLTAIAEVSLRGSQWRLHGFITDATLPDES